MRDPALVSVEAEQSLLGAVLLDNAAFDAVAQEVKKESFGVEVHGTIWESLARQLGAGKAADVVTVHDELRHMQFDEIDLGGMTILQYLNALATCVPSGQNAARYARLVIDKHRARMLSDTGAKAWELAGDNSIPIDERIERVSAELMRLLEQGAQREPVHVKTIMAEAIERIADREQGVFDFIPTGMRDIDEMLGGGLAPSDLVILGGRPGMGKTSMALDWLLHIAESRPVGFLSMEMSRAQLGDRMVASIGRIDLKLVKRPPARSNELFWMRLADAAAKAAKLDMHVDDQGGLNIAQVRAKARAMRRKHRIELLVVDYLQLMDGRDPRMPRVYQLEEISRGLKGIAKELNIPVVALAMVNREAERRANGYPTMADLKDCGSIEQDADVVFFVHRPIVMDPELGADFRYFAKGIFAKNRQGPTGTVNLTYRGHETRFSGWEGEEPVKPGGSSRKGFG